MGGLGTRFAESKDPRFKDATGKPIPKPLIRVNGEPMILKAIGSFSRLLKQQQQHHDASAGDGVHIVCIFIVRQEHEDAFKLKTLLSEAVTHVEKKFVMLDHDTRGAVETCLVAENAIDRTAPLVVCDCDLQFFSAAYESALMNIVTVLNNNNKNKSGEDDASSSSLLNGLPHGLLVYMNSRDPRYSYAETESDGTTVKRTAEKDPISDKALIGAYGFRTGAIFINAAKALCELEIDPAKGRKEYYVSLVYNFLLAEGKKVVALPKDEYYSFGTPEELEAFYAAEKEKGKSNKNDRDDGDEFQ